MDVGAITGAELLEEEGTTGEGDTDIMSEWWEFWNWFDRDDFSKIDHLDGSKTNSPSRDYDGIWDYNDPEEFNRVRNNDPFTTLFDPLLEWWKDKKIAEDKDKWYSDYEKNTGQSWRNSQYPWKSYYESGPGSYSRGGSNSAAFEASKSVMSLYGRWKKW